MEAAKSYLTLDPLSELQQSDIKGFEIEEQRPLRRLGSPSRPRWFCPLRLQP